jgi:hypothetical protein
VTAGEVVVDQVYPGNTVMPNALEYMVQAFEQTLGLDHDEKKRLRTIRRIVLNRADFRAKPGILDML